MRKNKKTPYIVVGIIVVLAVFGLAFAFKSNQILQTKVVPKSAPIFTFTKSNAPGWWAGGNFNARASATNDYKGSEPVEKLSVASMNVYNSEEGEYATACFIMFSYYDYKGDVERLKTDKEAEVLASASMKKIGESVVSMNAFGESKNFTLTNYELIGPDAENVMKGMSYGWVDLSDGYVTVSGVCPSAGELDNALAVMSAVSLAKQ